MKVSPYQFILFGLLSWVLPGLAAQQLEGMASFYGPKFDGQLTSTGETFRQTAYSAASLDMPWGTILEVTNLSNGKTTQVRINDCGPKARGRIIDLSQAAAEDLDMVKSGETKVRLRILQTSTAGPTCSRAAWAKKLKAQGKAIPPPPPPWDPTQTVNLKPVNPVVIGNQAADPARPVPTGATRGRASYYPQRLEGRPTSTGEVYRGRLLTAASKAFPYGTVLEVTNVANRRSVTVRVNDCGPNNPDRILDLSRAAADRIGLLRAGSAMVDLKVVELGTQGPTCDRSAWRAQQREGVARPAPGKLPTTAADSPAGPTLASTPPATAPATNIPLTYRTPGPVVRDLEAMVDAYHVQVGAFGQAANAERLRQRLIGMGFKDAYVQREEGLVKVYAGTTETATQAEDLRQQLVAKGFSRATVKPTQVADVRLAAATDPAPATYATPLAPPPATEPTPKRAEPEFSPDDILFGVQVGAFTTEAGAERTMEKLRAAGRERVYSARVGKVIRVFSGKFYFQSQAETEKEKVRAAGFPNATVRRVQ